MMSHLATFCLSVTAAQPFVPEQCLFLPHPHLYISCLTLPSFTSVSFSDSCPPDEMDKETLEASAR